MVSFPAGINPVGNQASKSNAHPVSPAKTRRPSSRKLRRQANKGPGRPSNPPQEVNPGTARRPTLAEVLEPYRRERRRWLHENPHLKGLPIPHKVTRPQVPVPGTSSSPDPMLHHQYPHQTNFHPMYHIPSPVVRFGDPHLNFHPMYHIPPPVVQFGGPYQNFNSMFHNPTPYDHRRQLLNLQPQVYDHMTVPRPAMGSLLDFGDPPSNIDPPGNQAYTSNAHPVSPAPNPAVGAGNPCPETLDEDDVDFWSSLSDVIEADNPLSGSAAPDPNQPVNSTSLKHVSYAHGMLAHIIRPRLLSNLPPAAHAMIVLRRENGSLLRKPPRNPDTAIKATANFHQFSLRHEIWSLR